MTSKVLVKLPTVPFSQGKKPPPELVALASRNETTVQIRNPGGGGDRTVQSEQNIKFLQEQHQATLVALHQEVETLRQRNRDLQFQLVFSKGAVNALNSPSSPEDNENGFVKQKVELLERDLQDLKASLQEAKTQNHYLSGIIEQQKKKLDMMESESEKLVHADVAVQAEAEQDVVQLDLAARLEDAEAMVQCLRRENEDQKKEISTLKAMSSKGNGSGRSRGSNGHQSRGSNGNGGQEQSSNKFPPLHTQSYWYHGSRGNNSFDHPADYHASDYRRSRQEKQDRDSTDAGSTVLPQLRNGGNRDDSTGYPPFHSSRGHEKYNHYYRESYYPSWHREGGNRKYRGQRSQRDCKERESRDQHRDFKERDAKEQSKEHTDSAHGSRDTRNSRKP